jgi:hypothetical protein
VADFHRFHRAIDDQRRAETRTETEEEHASALITAQRLHGRIVDHPHRPPEDLLEFTAHPTRTQVVGLRHNAPAQHRAGIADRHGPVR